MMTVIISTINNGLIDDENESSYKFNNSKNKNNSIINN